MAKAPIKCGANIFKVNWPFLRMDGKTHP